MSIKSPDRTGMFIGKFVMEKCIGIKIILHNLFLLEPMSCNCIEVFLSWPIILQNN